MLAVTTKYYGKCWGCCQYLLPRFSELPKQFKKRRYCNDQCLNRAYQFRVQWRRFDKRKQDLSHWLPSGY